MHLFQKGSRFTADFEDSIVESDKPTYRPSQPPTIVHYRLDEDGCGYFLIKVPGQDHTGLSAGKRKYIGTTFLIVKVTEVDEDEYKVSKVVEEASFGRKWGMVMEMQERLNRTFEGVS